ncbi:hypothetical protein IFM89_015465 [Coptis chinensis]|uniref:DAGKc domain-containing protein n=1 Tax=Coptis chinensis TaxID=261450 RepID=A0A835IAA8_9MAGN|nr:hypothetical protein IFM89_015465 [Coptis chinensis]
MMSGCGRDMRRNGNVGVLFFKRMLFDMVEPNYITFISLVSRCVELHDIETGKQLHCFIVKFMLSSNHVVCSALVDLYGKCGLVEDARRLFNRILPKDLMLWNVMISCYTLNGLGENAMGIFELLRSEGLNGDDFTFSSLLCSCGIMGSGDLGKQIHGLIIRLSFDVDMLVSSALVDMYVKTDFVVDGRKAFNAMTTRNVVSWTTMIVGYGRHGNGKEAMQLLTEMLQGDFVPDELTLASILSSCATLAAIAEITQVHAHVTKKGLDAFLSIGNALINAYSKCGSIASAFQSFSSIKEPNLITWSSIISAYAFHGLARKAVQIFEEMLSKGVSPDRIAFLGVLSACSHGGLVDEGFHYFGSMTNNHQIVPGLEHYACLIDLLGRAGNLDRAYDILENMPIEPGANVLGAFIGACKAHGNIRLAVLAAEKLFKLEPEDPVSYTLVSNIYAFVGRWVDVARVRKLMRSRCDHKVPGCSWIEVGGKVHTFSKVRCSHICTCIINHLYVIASATRTTNSNKGPKSSSSKSQKQLKSKQENLYKIKSCKPNPFLNRTQAAINHKLKKKMVYTIAIALGVKPFFPTVITAQQDLSPSFYKKSSSSSSSTRKGDLIFVVNPKGANGRTGKEWKKLLPFVRSRLGKDLNICESLTSGPCHAIDITREAIREGAEAVVAVGGDGTLHEVINGFFWAGKPVSAHDKEVTCTTSLGGFDYTVPSLQLIPLGTGSDFARTFGWKDDPREAVERIARGLKSRIDIGVISGESGEPHYFVNVADIHLSAKAGYYASRHKKFGNLCYVIGALQGFSGHTNRDLRIKVDEGEWEVFPQVTALCMGNAKFFGGGMKITPNANPYNGNFEVVILQNFKWYDFVFKLHKLYSGTHLSEENVCSRSVQSIEVEEIEGGSGVYVQSDGEHLGFLPRKFHILPAAVEMLC